MSWWCYHSLCCVTLTQWSQWFADWPWNSHCPWLQMHWHHVSHLTKPGPVKLGLWTSTVSRSEYPTQPGPKNMFSLKVQESCKRFLLNARLIGQQISRTKQIAKECTRMSSISWKLWATRCHEIRNKNIAYMLYLHNSLYFCLWFFIFVPFSQTCRTFLLDWHGTTVSAKSKRGFGAERVLLICPAQGAASRWRVS